MTLTNENPTSLEELKRSEATFRAMFETSAVGIGILSLERKIIEVNPAMCKMFGLTREEFIGMEPKVATLPQDYTRSTEEFKELLAGKREYYWAEHRYVRKSGQVFWAHVTMSVVRDESGTPLYMVGMLIDINEQKRDHEMLRESEARFKAMFESSAVGVFILDVENLTIRANAAARAIIEDPNVDKELLDIHDFIDERYRAEETELLDQLLRGERESYEAERRYQRTGQEPRWAKVTFSSVRGADRQVRYLVVMIEETTAQKKAQESLVQSERRFRAMFDNTSIGIALTGLDRSILQVNEAASRLTGYPIDELVKLHPSLLALPQDRAIADDRLQEMVSGKRDGILVERRFLRKDGSVFWGRVTYSLVRDPERRPLYLIGLIEDITEQKLAAEKLEAQEAEYISTLDQRVQERTRELSEANLRLVSEIEQRQKAEEALAAKAAEEATTAERTRLARDLHDAVTQTLFSASLIAEVLPDMWKLDEQEARKSTEELRQLTRGALAEMRTLLLELRPASLTQARFPDLLKQLGEAVIGRARLPVRLDVSGDYEMPAEVKVAFYRVTQESLNNIVKYARATQVEILLSQECCNVHLEITDNGIGFDPASIRPTSLGMRIMRERAEAIQAQLEVISQPGKGTTVSLDWNENGSPIAPTKNTKGEL